MITVRQIERQWDGKAYGRLLNDLLAARPEGAWRLGVEMGSRLPAAAMAVIRLDELDQSHIKLYPKLIQAILAAQEADGGWGDLMTTALCLRALFCGKGTGVAIDGALSYLAALQKAEGIWPRIPIRRMAADPYVSALLLYQLGDQVRFRQAVRIADALNWFTANERSLDPETRSLWSRVRVRCRVQTSTPVPCLS